MLNLGLVWILYIYIYMNRYVCVCHIITVCNNVSVYMHVYSDELYAHIIYVYI